MTSAQAQESRAATDALFAGLYPELHRLGRSQLARLRAAGTLDPTTLLHEAYLRISRTETTFPDRAQFLAYAARAMRGLIIDHLRRDTAQKRGGLDAAIPLEQDAVASTVLGGTAYLERLGDALDELATRDPPLAQTVDLRFFSGFSFRQIAAVLGTSERTAQRHWEKARIYLRRAVTV